MKKHYLMAAIACVGSVAAIVSTGKAFAYASPNPYVQYIITKESGGNPNAENSIGCYGIMQKCPGSPLKVLCGANGDCQLSFFDNYCRNRYGSWQAAYNFHRSHNWW